MFFWTDKKYQDLTKEVEERDKRIEELEAELARKNKAIDNMTHDINVFTAEVDGTPDGCERGEWCRACEFGKEFTMRYGYGSVYTAFLCGKGESCPNFVQKEV